MCSIRCVCDSDVGVLFNFLRLYLAYKRMRNPGCIEIDASGSVESVMTMAEAELTKLK